MKYLRNLFFWLFIGRDITPPTPNRPAILLFELGSNIQVYHFPTPEEITRGTLPTEVYWQNRSTKRTYGPFPSIYVAMTHYTHVITNQKANDTGKIGNVIYVDFKTKKRIQQ